MTDNNSFVRLSIIIPMYNTEEYLQCCLESIIMSPLKQDEYEIIIWNDGSTDRSLDIATYFANNNPQIKVYSDENNGVSYARNKALQKALGRYVWFVDSDDTIYSDRVLHLLELAEDNDLDMLVFNFSLDEPNGLQYIARDFSDTTIQAGYSLYKKHNVSLSVWRELYRREFLLANHIFFPLNFKASEDFFFNYQVWYKAKRCMGSSLVGYSYKQHSSSMVHKNPWKVIEDRLSQIKYIMTDSSFDFSDEYKSIIVYRSLRAVNVQLRFIPKDKFDESFFRELIRTNLCYYLHTLTMRSIYIYTMRVFPLLFFKSKECVRKILSSFAHFYHDFRKGTHQEKGKIKIGLY